MPRLLACLPAHWRLAERSVCAQELRLEGRVVFGGAGFKAWPAGLQPMSEEDKEVAHCVGCGLLVRVSFRCKDMVVRLFACCALSRLTFPHSVARPMSGCWPPAATRWGA